MAISKDSVESIECPCGCGKSFPRHTGSLDYSPGSFAVYRTWLMQEVEGEPHLWTLLGTGPWFDDDERGCWVTVHQWLDGSGNLAARVEDPEASPFSPADAADERRLTRDEVRSMDGASQWVFDCADLLVESHPAVRRFLGL